jgi:flagellar basal body-associated protein FliL
MYPRARPYERRSRMQMFYLMVSIVVVATAALAAMLWFLNKSMPR